MGATAEINFDFIVGNDPAQLKRYQARNVRSHVSKMGWKGRVRVKRVKIQQPLRPRRQIKNAAVQEAKVDSDFRDVITTVRMSPPGDWQLGGGRSDPFHVYPGQRRAYVPALIDHYIVHMAVDIPELDRPGNKGLLRSSWFPLVISDLAIFQTIMLLSAANAASLKPNLYSKTHLLELKSDAINSINRDIRHGAHWASDALIGACAKMASFEAMYGNLDSFHVHMAGLCRMLELRGGLDALGLGGLLRRIVIWIDLNSAFLLKSGRYFPGQYFGDYDDIAEPNPQSFLAP
ncbi:unnamed protein product [Clonostachys rosea]|uniref:Uncharacterized protein n=1 Tax=Bionectria ochroleuca TaxID=29856 RepID=A0ABY6U9Q5_BIOOC|nr:unnamed protein product [Clonostachys rosea]